MGSAVSCTNNTKVTKTAFQKEKEAIEGCTDIIQSTSPQGHKSDLTDAPPSNHIFTPPKGGLIEAPPSNHILTLPQGDFIENTSNHIASSPPDSSVTVSTVESIKETSVETMNQPKQNDVDKDSGTEKIKAKEEAENGEKKVENELMTDEELEEFRRKTLDYLRDTAMQCVALENAHEKGGAFVTKIRNSAIRFMQSYFALKKTVRENIVKFRVDIAQLMIETKYLNLSCEIVMYTYKNGWRLEDGKEDQSKSVPLANSMVTLLNFSDGCDEFAIALADEPGFLDTIKQILVDSLPKYFAKEDEPKLKGIDERLMKNSLSIVHNMSMRESNISKLRDAGMISCLKPYLKSPNDMYALNALASLAGIINEDECDVINSNKQIVMILLDFIRKGMKDKMRRCRGWSCQECVFTVKLLARNDANMKTLVDLGALELLVEMARIGDENEQYESVSALWALCFDEDNQSLITGKPELEVVDLLVDLKSSESEKIKKACNGALWTLRDALKKTVVEKYKKIGEQFGGESATLTPSKKRKKKRGSSAEKISAEPEGHVMISYQWADQQVLKNVRDNIKARGYKVWMDIDQMGGSTLQAMADAVEGAEVFLMCMSNKYKHSPACRAEAEYAFQLRKKIIPLKMERGYTPDGWLGFIVGAKLFFEFSPKYPFEDKMKALLKEIDCVLGAPGDQADSGEIIKPQVAIVTDSAGAHSLDHADTASAVGSTVARISVAKTTIDNVRKWTAEDAKKWIDRNGLENCGISGLTGGEIALLASMRVECPEFFYKCLQDMLYVKDLLTMSKIVWALHDLS